MNPPISIDETREFKHYTLDFKSIILKLNEVDRGCRFTYITDGFVDIFNYGEIEVFATEYVGSDEYFGCNEDQFVDYIIERTKKELSKYAEGIE